MEEASLQRWLKISLFNLLLVSLAGVLLRYKIAFALPWLNQKYLLHGHSHFAFAGWLSQALMALMVQYLKEKGHQHAYKKYKWLLIANLVTAYGMLVSFPLQGYGLFPILFSTASIFVSYAFAIIYIKDLNRLVVKDASQLWFKAALLFNALSSLGAFSLAYLMATKQANEQFYLSAIYFFLHFQYNGWFFFACMGSVSSMLISIGIASQKIRDVFLLFFVACFPAYLLSTLWLQLPVWIYWLVVMASVMQLYAWIKFIMIIKNNGQIMRERLSNMWRIVFYLVGISGSIKLLLQSLSVIPSLSKLAFGFRPIVIGYLHLVLLGVISLFLLAFIFSKNYLPFTKSTRVGMITFIAGVVLNETVLMLQGAGGMSGIAIPHADWMLLACACVLFVSICMLNSVLFFSKYASTHKATVKHSSALYK